MSESTRRKVLTEEIRIKFGGSPDPNFDIATVYDTAITVVNLRKRAQRHRDAMRLYLDYVALVGRLSRMTHTDMTAGILHSPLASQSYLGTADFAADVNRYAMDGRLFVEAMVQAQGETLMMEAYAQRYDNRVVDPVDLIINRAIELTTAPGDNN